MNIDVTQIVTLLDYFTRLISSFLNKILVMLGMSELENNSLTFPATNDILHANPNGVINR